MDFFLNSNFLFYNPKSVPFFLRPEKYVKSNFYGPCKFDLKKKNYPQLNLHIRVHHYMDIYSPFTVQYLQCHLKKGGSGFAFLCLFNNRCRGRCTFFNSHFINYYLLFRSTGFILEGFPYDLEQVGYMLERQLFPDVVVVLEVEVTDVQKRLLPTYLGKWRDLQSKHEEQLKLLRHLRQINRVRMWLWCISRFLSPFLLSIFFTIHYICT